MGLGDVIGSLRSKIPFLNKEEDDSDMDFDSESPNFGDEAPSTEGGAQEAPADENPFGDIPPAAESQETAPFAGEEPPAGNPFSAPAPQPAPQPVQAAPQYPLQQQLSSDAIKIDIDNIKQRIENLMHKFDTISAELDTVRSENEFEKALLQRYDFYLRDIVSKIDNMEKQHESMWNEMRAKKP